MALWEPISCEIGIQGKRFSALFGWNSSTSTGDIGVSPGRAKYGFNDSVQ
jgi:hypothetical protein